MKMIRKILVGIVLLLPMGFISAPAQAVPVEYELAILIDGSGSILPGDFNTQKTAYVNVLNDLYTHHNLWGRNAISVWQFSNGPQMESATIKIDDAGDLATLTGIIAGMSQLGGATNIGDTILQAADELFMNSFTAGKMVIDVSTDGYHNTGTSPYTAAANVVGLGIDQVNCLGIGTYGGGTYDCGFHAGVGSFETNAQNYAMFEQVLHDKLHRELDIPVPATFLLMGIGLVALGSATRRVKNSTV